MVKKKQKVRANNRDEQADVMVSIGDLTTASVNDVKLDKNYEDMAEDFIGTFNNAVTQGQAPIKALYSMIAACAIILGNFIRAGLRQQEVGKLLMMMGKSAAAASKMFKILENQSVGQAVSNVIKTGQRKMN